MVKRHVRVYIEGGAEGKIADSDFRRSWKKFLNELHEIAMANSYHSLEVVRGKGRGNAFRRFKKHELEYPDDLCVLLVDSEGPVASGQKVWDVVAQRPDDRWEKPDWARESHLYLIVQFVETWLLTDQEALRTFFKIDFKANQLPETDLEQRSKDEIDRALKAVTRELGKRAYHHGQANEIIKFVRPERVKTLSHGRRLFISLGSLIRGEPET